MAKHCQHLANLHPIVLQNAETQALFVFVQGVLAVSPETGILTAIRLFEERFGLEDFNRRAALTKYYRMLKMSKTDNKLFKDGKDQSHKAGNGAAGRIHRKNLGTTAFP